MLGFFFLTDVSHEITNEDLQRTAIRTRNVLTSWKNMMPPSAEDWEGLVVRTFYIPASYCHYKWHLGPKEKFSHSKLILPFRVQEVKEKKITPCNVPNKTQRKVFSGTAGHQGPVSSSHTVFTFAHLLSFAEPHKGGQLHESWLGNWDLVLQSHTPVSPKELLIKQFWTELEYTAF